MNLNAVSPLITIYEDSTKLIGKLNITVEAMQYIEQEERFGESFGNIRIEKNGHVAIHSGTTIGNAFVRGICEYSLGKHKIRFMVKRKNVEYYLSFGIISKLTPIPRKEDDMNTSTYGWRSNDTIMRATTNTEMSVDEDVWDMTGETTFEIELMLDCDNRKISYFNQETKNTREMTVDITICPFPWQLLFNLFNVDDCVQLTSSSQQ